MRFRSLLRHYTRGILRLFVIVLLGRLLWTVMPSATVDRGVEWLSGGADRWVFVALGILVLPPLTGWTAGNLARPLLRRHRGLRSILQAEESLITELAPDEARGFSVVLVDWPRADLRTIGLLTSVSAATGGRANSQRCFFREGSTR